jgi:asparagine synthase (glutamine-hydrolysing)
MDRRRCLADCYQLGQPGQLVAHRGDHRDFPERDRGHRPVHQYDGRFAVASEIPALLATGLPGRQIDLAGLGLFWQLEYIPAPHSALAEVRKLPAGHALVLEENCLRIWRYYPPREVPAFQGPYEEAMEQLGALLEDATGRRPVSDVPIGIALSGGIDSASVVAAYDPGTIGDSDGPASPPQLGR